MARGTGPQIGTPPGVRPLTAGDPVIIGRYLLLGRLGAGGMGVVYLAEHPQGGFVALKTPHSVHLPDPTLQARFAEEVAFSRRVRPFCTAAVIEDGLDRDRPYLVTEHIPGPALSQVVAARGALAPEIAYGVALGAAAALVATHGAGLVHRDLKPANVLLSPRGPFVIDFGIARDIDAALAHTQTGQVMGSPGWVSPERLTGGRAIPASDVFSWGCLVAFASTGLHPFGTEEPDVVMRRILVEEPRVSAVPRPLRETVAAALRKEPGDRPPATELLSALLAAGGVLAAGEIMEPHDPRAAVDAVLAEVWQPVPYPVGGGLVRLAHEQAGDDGDRHRGMLSGNRPGSQPESHARSRWGDRSAGRSGMRHRGGRASHVSHAGFAALATVTIAAMTVIAAGTGTAQMESSVEQPSAEPVVIRGEDSLFTPPAVLGRPRPRGTAARETPDAQVTITSTRTITPSPTLTGDPLEATTPSPHPNVGATPPQERCSTPNGEPRPCGTRSPVPVSQEPQWGDGEPPQPSSSPTPSVPGATAGPSAPEAHPASPSDPPP